MSKEQRFMLQGMLTEKKAELENVTYGLRARISSISVMIMPEMDIDDQKFTSAKLLIDECCEMKRKYNNLKGEIKQIEDSI